MSKLEGADWKGRLYRRFVWCRLRFEWGRWCYNTDALGQELNRWWEPEEQASAPKLTEVED